LRKILIILLMAALPACTPAISSPAPQTPAPGQIEFTISIGEDAEGGFTIALGLLNHGPSTLPAQSYTGTWTLTTSSGDPRASGEGLLPQIEPADGQPQNVIIWGGPLEPGNYIFQWGVPQLGSTVARFEINSGVDGPRLGAFSTD